MLWSINEAPELFTKEDLVEMAKAITLRVETAIQQLEKGVEIKAEQVLESRRRRLPEV